MWKSLILSLAIAATIQPLPTEAAEYRLDENLNIIVQVEEAPLRNKSKELQGTSLQTYVKINDSFSTGLFMGMTTEKNKTNHSRELKQDGLNMGVGFSFSF